MTPHHTFTEKLCW